jgi:hypothetical protein
MPLLRTESLLGNLLLLSILISNVSLSHIYVNATSPSIPQQSNNLVDSLSFDLGPYVNNKAFGEGADLDGMGTFFSGHSFQRSSLLINNSTCNSAEKGFDNIKVNDQMAIPLQIGSLTSLGALYTLVSATHGPLTAKITVSYTDKTQDSTILSLPDWQDALANQIERNQAAHQPLSNGNKSAMFSVPIYVNPVKKLAQLHLLQDQKKEPSDATLRVFSLVGYSTQSKLVITSVQATHEWINTSEQVIIVRVHNIGAEFIRNASIHVSGQVNTVKASEYSKGKHDRSNCTRFYSYDTRHGK